MISTFPIREIKVLLYRSKVSRYGIYLKYLTLKSLISFWKFLEMVAMVTFYFLPWLWMVKAHSYTHNSHHIMPLCKFSEGCWISLLIRPLKIVSHCINSLNLVQLCLEVMYVVNCICCECWNKFSILCHHFFTFVFSYHQP